MNAACGLHINCTFLLVKRNVQSQQYHGNGKKLTHLIKLIKITAGTNITCKVSFYIPIYVGVAAYTYRA